MSDDIPTEDNQKKGGTIELNQGVREHLSG
jgi:hypothetical protein